MAAPGGGMIFFFLFSFFFFPPQNINFCRRDVCIFVVDVLL